MAAQAGQLSGWPAADWAGIPTPVWVATNERRNSGGDYNHQPEGVTLCSNSNLRQSFAQIKNPISIN
ncbi:ash family protein [Salmonella enterica]|nr:ash family protein [Salmonella enterica]EHM6196445.1 ash family protein [Salmonella enterica]